MHQAIHAPRMHALRPDDLDEAAVRKEGYDRCFKQRIYELYQKNTEMPVEEVDRIVEGTNDLKHMYRDLCIRYGVVPGIPLWVPPPDRPDWLPDFLLRQDDKKKVDAKEEDEESDGPPDETFKPPAPKYKVQIRPAAKQASRPKGQPSMPARPPVPPKPPVMVPAPPPAPAPKPMDPPPRPVRVIWLETQTTGQVVCMHGVCSCIHSCTHAYMLKCGRLPNWKFWPQNGFCSAMHFLNRSCKNMFKSDLRRCRLRNTMRKMQW